MEIKLFSFFKKKQKDVYNRSTVDNSHSGNTGTIQIEKRRQVAGVVNNHGFQTVILNKFEGYLDCPEFYKQVIGSNVVQPIAKFSHHVLAKDIHNLLTNGGRDQMHSQVYNETNAANTEAGSSFIAVSSGTTNETASSTTLETEIASGGLSRADATTNTHTAGTNTTTLAKTFTASATHTAVHKSATFNASSSGTMTHVANFSSDATLVSGDTLTVTWTLTLG